MTIKFDNLDKWASLPVGSFLQLPGGEKPRRLRVEVNCPLPTRIDVVEHGRDAKLTHLAVVQGRETIQFVATDLVELVFTSEDEVWYFTSDGDQIAVEIPEATSFTKIASRRARNPELEMLMFKQQQNIERRMASMQADFDARIAEVGVQHDPSTGEIDDGENSAGDAGGSGGSSTEPPAGNTEQPAAGKGASPKPGTEVPGTAAAAK